MSYEMVSERPLLHFLTGFALGVLVLFAGIEPAAAQAGVTYHGRLLDANGDPVVRPSVKFKIQIRTPGNENCLLYEEQQTKDLTASKGIFAITLGDAGATVLNTEPFGLARAFQNRGTFSFAAGKCVTGTNYVPNATDGRRIALEFNDGSFVGWEPIPVQTINFVPMAFESVTVGGFDASSLFRVVDVLGAPTAISPLTLAQHNALLDLANGTGTLAPGQIGNSSITDAKIDTVSGSKVTGNIAGNAAGFTGSLSGDVTGTQGATTVTKIQGRAVDTAAPTNGQALVWSAGNSRWEPGTVSGGGGGDWSTLTGKPSTFPSDWTTLANKPTSFTSDWTTTANKPTSFPSDWSTLTNIPSSFPPSAHTHSVADLTSGAGSYLTYQPNGAACSAGEVLKWETAGGGRWICGVDATGGGGGAVNSVTGTAPVTVNNTDPANPVVSVNASVTSTNNSLVQRDGAGAIQSAGANFGSLQVNNGSSTITLGTPAAFTSYVLKLPSGTGTNGQILTSNGTDMIWSNASSITASNVSGTVAIANGGTGATTAANARTNLGITATGDSIVTAANAAAARTAIGAMIDVAAGTNGSVLTSNGTSWTSAALPVASGAARGVMQVGSGLAVSTGTVSADFGTGAGKVAQGNDSRFPSSTCGAGNKMRWDGTAWQCEATTDSTKVAKTGDSMSGSLTINADLTVTGLSQAVAEKMQGSVNSGTSLTLGALSNGNIYRVTLTGNATLTLPADPGVANGMAQVVVVITQDATGSRTLTWAAPGGDSILWSGNTTPTVCAGASEKTIYQFVKMNGDGTWYAAQVWRQCN